MGEEMTRGVNYGSWANPAALHEAYILHPAAPRSRVNQSEPGYRVPYVTFAARDLSNVIRTLVALHPTVAADLLRYHTGGLAEGCFGGEATALMMAAEDVGVDLMALARS